ncbi:ribbon-helix-helix domain-containing protein [Desulfovibrio psychrotolerans]|uniref:Ribbon-helix-helix domain-containing protein n=1 Tax=Desulfovibrio psychrotolerans TaxID=415242 RepID=A0A7J0BSJ9_9BACT|nr:ribbon-helix-helix domain-containing protein [Desulfovibrio psychrotolerans]GFM36171.1 hypothetical protein DSM19430T_08550 [Desulfovibrio psychrotolerans]
MCRIYASTEPAEYEQVTRSVRLHGGVTSVRLERRFWAVLEELAESEDTSLPKFLEALHDEAVALHGQIGNFASLLRVVCATYLDTVRSGGYVREVADRPQP